jgi:hypothetical protein
MKKDYAAPTITTSGDAVRETKGSFSNSPDDSSGSRLTLSPGAVGFNL